MNGRDLFRKIAKRWARLWLKPIRVFCFHQVSDAFEPETMWECDWTQIDVFKRIILDLKKKYTFISLPEVTEHLRNDRFRMKRYAALTADDGWASLKNIIPWLVEQKIPVTLFLNPLYMDGKCFRKRVTERFLTKEEVDDLVVRYEPFITIASHGWSHDDCSKMAIGPFKESVERSEAFLGTMKGKVPFYAFTYGRYNGNQLDFLRDRSIIPVLANGRMNYCDASCIHRECMDQDALMV